MYVKSVNLTSLVVDIHFLQSLAKPWQDGGEARQMCVCECLGVQARGCGVSRGRGEELSLVLMRTHLIHDLQEVLGAL